MSLVPQFEMAELTEEELARRQVEISEREKILFERFLPFYAFFRESFVYTLTILYQFDCPPAARECLQRLQLPIDDKTDLLLVSNLNPYMNIMDFPPQVSFLYNLGDFFQQLNQHIFEDLDVPRDIANKTQFTVTDGSVVLDYATGYVPIEDWATFFRLIKALLNNDEFAQYIEKNYTGTIEKFRELETMQVARIASPSAGFAGPTRLF